MRRRCFRNSHYRKFPWLLGINTVKIDASINSRQNSISSQLKSPINAILTFINIAQIITLQ